MRTSSWLLILLFGCGGYPRTPWGAELDDPYGFVDVRLAGAVEQKTMDWMQSLGYEREQMQDCLEDTVVHVVSKIVGEDLRQCGKGCTAFQQGDRIVFDVTRNPCLEVYAHELQHRFLLCAGEDKDGHHLRPELWGKESFLEYYWQNSCLGGVQ